MNRYGDEVFTGGSRKPWDGGNSPAGVYYWVAYGDGCENKKQTARGFVELVR